MNQKNIILTMFVLAGIGVLGIILISSLKVPPSSLTTGLVQEAFYPEPTNYAVDKTGTLSAEQLFSLNAKLKAMDSEKHQFGVVIVKTTQPLDIESYGIKLAEKWKVGYKGLDNGAIIIIAKEDRKVRIEVGYGLEGDIPDSVAGRILDNQIVPLLKEGKWYEAIVAGLDELNNKIK